MKLFLIISFFISILLFSCKSKSERQVDNTEKNTNKYAQFFKIIEHKRFTEIQIINPDKQTIEKRFALAENVSSLKLTKDFIPVMIPLQSIITLNGTDIGMLSKLELSDKIVGVSNMMYIYNPQLKKNFKRGKIKEINDFSQMNPEKVSQLSQFISYSGFGTPPTNEEKLGKLGVICLPNYDWREIHPLGKAEWIKIFAAFFKVKEKANNYFKAIEKQFKTLEKEAKSHTKMPSVLSGSIIGDFWYMPSGNSYNAYLIESAKGDFVGKHKLGTGSQTYSMEEIIKNYQNTEIWINPGFQTKKELLQANEKYKHLAAFKSDQIYCYSHDMNRFWELSAVEPQKVLSDLIEIFHPKSNSKKKLYFYKKLKD